MKHLLHVSLVVFTLLLAPVFNLQAQKASFGSVMAIEIRNMGPIIQDNEVKGYYAFYKVDKVDRKTNEYLLKILDPNLTEIASKKMEDSKDLYLQEGTYDGEFIMLSFFEAKKKQVILKKFSQKAELISSKIIQLKTAMEMAYYYTGQQNEIKGNYLFALKNKGFINYSHFREKGMAYHVDYISSGDKGWSYKSDINATEWCLTTQLAATPEVNYSLINKRPGMMSKDFTYHVLALDLATGKKVFEKKIEDAKYDIQVMNGFVDNDGVLTVVGQYFDKGKRSGADVSVGICAQRLDKSGKVISTKLLSWATDISKVLPVDAKGKMKDIGFLFFHNFMQTADGKIHAVAEDYRKAASAAGIAMNVLSGGRGGASYVKIVVGNMYTFRFGSDFSLERVDIIEKEKNDVELPAGLGI
jgi:hypothetical protein